VRLEKRFADTSKGSRVMARGLVFLYTLSALLGGSIQTTEAADNPTSFIIDMTHAFYAKVLCADTDVIYDSFVKEAQSKKLDSGLVEEVRKGIAFLNTNGQMGERGRKSTMDAITLAAKMITVDKETVGIEAWCKHRSKSLLEKGFIQSVTATPTIEDMNKRLDEQFADMRKGMPMQVSPLSRLTNAQRVGTTLNYTYEDKIPADKWTDADKKKLATDVTKTQCDGKNTRWLMELGFSFGAIHVDENGRFIAHVFVDKTKCN